MGCESAFDEEDEKSVATITTTCNCATSIITFSLTISFALLPCGWAKSAVLVAGRCICGMNPVEMKRLVGGGRIR